MMDIFYAVALNIHSLQYYIHDIHVNIVFFS